MEWIEGQMYTEKTGKQVEFSDRVRFGGKERSDMAYRVITNGNTPGYLVYDDDGNPSASCESGFERIIHRPPVPAKPCEHRHVDKNSKCIHCGEQRQLPPDPANAVTFSNTAPPDSVSIARRIASSSGVIDANDLREFCNAYDLEHSAQRKTAGELAASAAEMVAWHKKCIGAETPYQKMASSFYEALAADAQARAGTVNSKRD